MGDNDLGICMKEVDLRITLECGHTFCGVCLKIWDDVGTKRLSKGIEVGKMSSLLTPHWRRTKGKCNYLQCCMRGRLYGRRMNTSRKRIYPMISFCL